MPLRAPFLIAALVCSYLVLLVDVGGSWSELSSILAECWNLIEAIGDLLSGDFAGMAAKMMKPYFGFFGLINLLKDLLSPSTPPAYAAGAMITVDLLLAFTITMMTLPLLIPPKLLAKTQGPASCLIALVNALFSLMTAIKCFAMLMLMVTLLLAIPIGTLVYLLRYGSFELGPSAALLSSALLLKLICAVCLVLAHELFLKNKGLVALTATAILLVLLISFLHGFVPFFLVAIVDALAAIIVAVIAIIWDIIIGIGGLISCIKLVLSLRKLE
jgi:hypothetical protein